MINLEQIDEQGSWVSLTTLDGRELDLNIWKTKENHILITFYPTKSSQDDASFVTNAENGSFDLTKQIESISPPTDERERFQIDELEDSCGNGVSFDELLHWEFVLTTDEELNSYKELDFYDCENEEYLEDQLERSENEN